MNFLVIGSGAREHIMARRLSDVGVKIFSILTNRNPGLLNLSEEYLFLRSYHNNIRITVDFALSKGISTAPAIEALNKAIRTFLLKLSFLFLIVKYDVI